MSDPGFYMPVKGSFSFGVDLPTSDGDLLSSAGHSLSSEGHLLSSEGHLLHSDARSPVIFKYL